MSSSPKHDDEKENNRGISGEFLRLYQRLNRDLDLGSWKAGGQWHSADIDIQQVVLQSADAFLDCISSEISSHPIVKDSLVVIARALQSILGFRYQSLLKLVSDVAVKLLNIIPSSSMQSDVFNLLHHLADLLSYQHYQVAISCAMALNVILPKLSSRQETEVWHVMKETKAVDHLVCNVKLSCPGKKPVFLRNPVYFQAMASVLSKILWRWPTIRFSVWNDSEFLKSLDAINLISDNSVRVVLLQLYSGLALCGNGAEKLLENGELIQMMMDCMDNSNTYLVRLEAFKLARCFARRKRGFVKITNLCCEILVKAVTSAMTEWNSISDKLDKSQMCVVEEACHLASVTRWEGDHHEYFWKEGIVGILLDLLLDDYHKIQQLPHEFSATKLRNTVQKCLKANRYLSLRPFLWDILGGLAANCTLKFNNEMYGSERQHNALIICACSSFIDSIGMWSQISESNLTNMSEGESAARAVLMMVYSPSASLASLSRKILFEIINSSGKLYVEYFLRTLNTRLSSKKFGLPRDLQIMMCLMSLACYCSTPMYRQIIIKCQGLKILVKFIQWWLKNPVHVQRYSVVLHLYDDLSERTCCIQNTEEWEGDDTLLLFGLWILAELLDHYSTEKTDPSGNKAAFVIAQLEDGLKEICRRNSFGSRWYATYILSYFGLFGCPTKLGDRIGKLLGENDHVDLKLSLVNQEAVSVHEIILMVRCPALLHPEEKSSNEPTVRHDVEGNTMRTVHLSAQLDQQSLVKLLEYVYSGRLRASGNLVKDLIVLAMHYKLEALLQNLRRKHPIWGTPIPSFDLTPALRLPAEKLSNLKLEANTTELVDWKCNICSDLPPHLHVHKVILESSCDYFRGIFRSGMQESHSQAVSVNVPVSWESLNKLVNWLYSGRLPIPSYDCTWNNLEAEERSEKALHYLELCWLSKFWIIEDLHEECYDAFVSCLKTCTPLPMKIIRTAVKFSEWDLVEIAANHMAPSYERLRSSGELNELDDNLVEMIRLASTRLSQEEVDESLPTERIFLSDWEDYVIN